jgi:ribonuclease HII
MLKSHLEAGRIEVGCDEAGRGCLAGAVFAAAVLLPDGFSAPMLNDSKQLTEKQRDTLRLQIEKDTIWAVGIVSEREIDEINILNASFLAMHRALAQINAKFEHILVDGNRFKAYQNIPHTCIVKGDGKYLSIAAASVLAKTHRDEAMLRLAAEYPMYDWHKNKGYPTQAHRKAIAEYGATDYHRHSFQLLPLENQQTELFDIKNKE